MSKATVSLDAANPQPVEIIASSISAIAEAMRQIEKSRLTRRALVALLHDSSGISKRDINCVIDHLAYLEQQWLKDVKGAQKP